MYVKIVSGTLFNVEVDENQLENV